MPGILINMSANQDIQTVAELLAMAVENGQLAPDAVSVTGNARLSTAIKDYDAGRGNGRESGGLMFQLQAVLQYLTILDEKLTALEEEIDRLSKLRDEKLELAQQAFDNMHQAEDLRGEIADGVSQEERQRLIELLGDLAKDASPDELVILLELQIQKEYEAGNSLSSEAEELEQRIAERQREHDELQSIGDQIARSHSLDEATALIERYEAQKPEQVSSMETHIQNRDTAPDFNFPDFN